MPNEDTSWRNTLWRWGPMLAWMGLIFAFSAQSTLPHLEDSLWDLLLRKAVHMTEYAILAGLAARALGGRGRPALLIAWLIALLYAASDEFHQTFVPGRHGTPMDVLIDAAGALLGLVFWAIVLPRIRLCRPAKPD